MPPSARPQHRRVEIVHATGLEGARNAKGVVVVIDVLRSFTVSAYAFAGGAREKPLRSPRRDARQLANQNTHPTTCPRAKSAPVPPRPVHHLPPPGLAGPAR